MLLSAACRRDPEPRSVRERLEAAASGLAELEQLRQRHEALVRGVLEVREKPPELPEHRRREARRCPEEEALQENILLLRKQLSCLRRRDTGLITQLQELDRQISELRLDTEASHDPLEADSRPSSGFFDLSDGASVSLSNSSNSVFSECFCVTAEADAHFLSAEEHPGCLDCDWSQPPALDSAHQGDKTRLSSLSSAHLRLSAPLPPPPSAPPPAAASAAPQRRLDGYILGLLQRRAPPVRPGRPRTSISTEPSRGLRSGPDLRGLLRASGGALPGGSTIQKVSDGGGGVLMEKTRLLPPSVPRLRPPSHPSAPPGPRYLPAPSCRGREGAGPAGGGSGAPQGSRAAAVGGACGRSRKSSGRDLDTHRSARRRCHRHRRPRPPTLPPLPPRDPPVRWSGATRRSRGGAAAGQQPKQPTGRSAHRPRPPRRRQATGSESEFSAESASLLRCPLAEVGGGGSSSSSCFGDGESVQENLEKETSGRGRVQGRPLRQEVTRAVVRIKASHQLKKKILRFRSGSLKLMTTV